MRDKGMVIRKILLLFFCCLVLEAKPPEIAPRDVRLKIEEILKAHVCHKAQTPELMKRTLHNFLDELDPTKTYLIHEEIAEWMDPSEETLQRALIGFKTEDFSLFERIHEVFLSSVGRRVQMEEEMANWDMPTGVKSEEFKEIDWAVSYEDLLNRNLRIKAMQLEAAEKLSGETKDRFLQRLKKRRLHREQELSGSSAQEQKKVVLSLLLKAAFASLDTHTNYFTPAEASQFLIQVQQRLFGIGAQLRDDLDGLSVVRIIENSPASQHNKLKINDKIIAVDHEPVVGMEISDAVELIRGEKGTTVRLTLLRENKDEKNRPVEKLEIDLVRGEIVLEETRLDTSFEPYGDGAIAVLKLFSFYQDLSSSSALDIRKSIEQIKKDQPLRGVVLDLRGNSGGLLAQAVAVTGLFIQKGIVVSIKDNTGKIQHLREIEGKPCWDGPLLVLVDRASASAAEIVAQTLQDYGRAIVIGDDRTFGKGSFQTFTLDPIQGTKVNPKGEYKITRGKYYTVSGKSPQLTGVISDICVPGILSELDIGEKYAKFPLENDQIEPHFEDDLSDISPFYRIQLGPSYKHHLQPQLAIYTPYLDILKKNSKGRIESNKNYQNFLKEIQKKNFDTNSVDLFGQTDLQLTETLSVMKDLIFLMSIETSLAG